MIKINAKEVVVEYLEEEGDGGGGRVLDAITDMHLIFWQVLCRLWQEVLRML